jgi:nitrogenase molybdenum-iron protein NifN
MNENTSDAFATVNPCRVCAPLGAAMAMAGIEKAMTILHGSQGCATYIRRYIIGHFREPLDLASSNFSEDNAVFGGAGILRTAVHNVIAQYHPALVAIATTCIAETIGEDVRLYMKEISESIDAKTRPAFVSMSTPSYKGSHVDGFHAAVYAVASALAAAGDLSNRITILPGMVSPADIRYLREICDDFAVQATILPDYSETLDGKVWEHSYGLPPGGTPLADIQAMGHAKHTIEFGSRKPEACVSMLLKEKFGVAGSLISMPIGIRSTDTFMDIMSVQSGKPVPSKYEAERGRLVDAYIDGHKYVYGKRAVVYGDPDVVVALAGFCREVGIVPVLCASGAVAPDMGERIRALSPASEDPVVSAHDTDFDRIAEMAATCNPDIVIGSSKGYQIARQLDIPLVRVFFPVHDRIGSQRMLHLGYRGAQELFDRIVNALLAHEQNRSPVGYAYL